MGVFLNLPIRRQMFIILFIVALPTLGALIFSLVSERQAARERSLNEAQNLASTIASEQQNLVAGIHQLLTVLAQLPEVKSHDSMKLNKILADILRLNPQYTNINISDRNGAVWATAVPLSRPANQSNKRFFKNAITSGKFSSGEFTIGNITNKMTLHFALPFRNESGEIIGVVGCGVDITSFKRILDRSRLPKNSDFIILDHKGIVLTRTLDTEKYTGKSDDPYNFKMMESMGDEGGFIHSSLKFDGIKRYAYFYKLRLEGESAPYMYVRAGVPVGEITSAASIPILKSLLTLCLALISACSLAYFISKKSILQRVENLKIATQQLALGNLNIKFTDNVTGGELGELAQAFDETALKLARVFRTLEERNAFIESVLANLHSGIIVTDENYGIKLVNPFTASICGRSQDEFEGKGLDYACPVLYAELVSGRPSGEVTADHCGQEFILGYNSSELKNMDGTVGGHIINFRDLTEIVRIRNELRKKERLSAIGEVVANVAHEMRNPLFAMTTVAQILEMELSLKPEQKELLDAMLKESRRLNDLVEELLNSTRELRLKSKTVDLNKIIDQSLQVLQPLSEDTGVSIRKMSFANEIPIFADSEKLQQVMINLVKNAMEASSKGSYTDLSIDKGVGGVVVSIVDYGKGIPSDALERIFDVLYTTKKHGTGMGLPICRKIIEAHGGTLEAFSSEGRGTTFTVKLPFDSNHV